MADKKQKTEEYVLLRGTHEGFNEDGERVLYKAGDTVNLTENQAKAFADKFKTMREYNAARDTQSEIEQLRQKLADAEAKLAERAGHPDSTEDPSQPEAFSVQTKDPQKPDVNVDVKTATPAATASVATTATKPAK